MTISVGVGGAYKTVAAMWVGVGGAWKVVPKIDAGVGGAWKVGYSALAASATDAEGAASDFAASGLVTSDPTALTVTGGSGNYSYSWTKVSGEDFTISNNLAQNPYWYATLADGQHYATWKVTVTDTSYGVTAEDTITVLLQWANLS